jgi:hypothetical protein
MNITSEFFNFNVWEWFLHSLVLERTESGLSKINWLYGVILLHYNSIGALGQVFIVSHFLLDLFQLSGTRSQSWLWVAWPCDFEVRIIYIFGLRCYVGSIWCWFQSCKICKKVRQEVWACEDIKSVWEKHEQREDIFLPLTNFCRYYHVRSKKHTIPSRRRT